MLVTFACYFGSQIARPVLHGEFPNSSWEECLSFVFHYYKQRMRPGLISPDHPTKFPSSEIIKKEVIVIMLAILLNLKSNRIFEIKTHQKSALSVVNTT